MPTPLPPCPVCSGPLKSEPSGKSDTTWIQCRNCGDHHLSTMAVRSLEKADSMGVVQRARVAYRLRPVDESVRVRFKDITAWAADTVLPTPVERIDRLLMYMASRPEAQEPATLTANHTCAAIGAATHDQAKWAIDEAIAAGYLKGLPDSAYQPSPGFQVQGATLTMLGWKRYDDLMRRAVDSKRAFMAMDFKDEDLWRFLREHMQPTVKATGFDLYTTVDTQSAGNIINRMKVEIHTSRFLVCDLTHGNQGAYWEAGFAEGLGRPVVYTCRANVLADKNHPQHPHFDTAQQLIVKWDPADPAPGMQALKDVIRATLPAEAKMTDD